MKKHLFAALWIFVCALAFLYTGPTRATAQETAPAGNTIFLPLIDRNYQIPQSEVDALIALYHSTDGDNWYTKDEWLVSELPCSWYGVICEGGHVVRLELSTNRLRGDLPTELENLSSLQSLGLWGNQLTTLPAEFGNLSYLTTLYLDDNQLTTLPAEFGNLSILQRLGISNNQLAELPQSITRLNPAYGIDIGYNRLLLLTYPDLVAWLDRLDPDWRDTQTAP